MTSGEPFSLLSLDADDDEETGPASAQCGVSVGDKGQSTQSVSLPRPSRKSPMRCGMPEEY